MAPILAARFRVAGLQGQASFSLGQTPRSVFPPQLNAVKQIWIYYNPDSALPACKANLKPARGNAPG